MFKQTLNKGISEIIIVIVIGAVLAVGMFLFFRIKFPPTEMSKITEKTEESIKEEKSKKERIEVFNEEMFEDETADWDVYINEEYGYQIKYPKDWTYTESGIKESFVGFLPPGAEEGGIQLGGEKGWIDYKGDVTIFVSPNRNRESIEEYFGSEFLDFFNLSEGGYYEVKVGGKWGTRFKDLTGPTEIKIDQVIIPFDDWFFQFAGSQIKISDNLETFDKMLSTFRFIQEETIEEKPVLEKTPPKTSGCMDTDGGENIYEKGTLLNVYNATGKNPTDYCLDYAPGTLVEYSCEYNMEEGYLGTMGEGIYSASIRCPKGCKNGACVK